MYADKDKIKSVKDHELATAVLVSRRRYLESRNFDEP